MRAQANQYPETANLVEPVLSPVLSIDRDTAQDHELLHLHAHPEPMLTWSSTATLIGSVAGRDWLIPPGYGLWVPGGIEHSGAVLHAGEMTTITLAADGSPLAWTEPTSFAVGSLLGEIITHLHRIAPDDPSRSPAEALMFQLLTPLPVATYPRHHARRPASSRDRRAAHRPPRRSARAHRLGRPRPCQRPNPVPAVPRRDRTRASPNWRTQVRIRAAIPMLADGTPVAAAARAVGYRKPSAFTAAFHRTTGQTPGTYLPRPQ